MSFMLLWSSDRKEQLLTQATGKDKLLKAAERFADYTQLFW